MTPPTPRNFTNSNPRSATGYPRLGPAFTLTEMLVAIAITGILVLAVNQIFSDVSEAVSIGIGTSDVLKTSRIVEDEVARDAVQMVGPIEGGFIVIVNKRYDDQFILADDRDASPQQQFSVRSDQLLFIRRRADAEPVAPGATSGYASSSTAPYLRVWYGHVLRTAADGSASGDLGNAQNELASQWILGRHAMFLQNSNIGLPGVHANGGWVNAPVTGGYPGVANNLYEGTADVAYFGLTVGSSHGQMVGGAEPSDNPPNKSRTLWQSLAPNDYIARAMDYTFVSQRLRCNSFPAGNGFESWRIAQMHPYLAGHVSDFIVEFAGDFDDDGELDLDTDDRIIWYSGTNPPPNGTVVNDTGNVQAPIGRSAPGNESHFVFRHGPGRTDWPAMIRLRYRVHDPRGLIVGSDGLPGRWFEQIIAVRRD